MLSNRSMAGCTVIPVIAYPDVADAALWLQSVFGFTMRLRIGDHRAQLDVGDGCIVITDRGSVGGYPGISIMIRVENVDEHFETARENGAKIIADPIDFPYGERQYNAEDFAGYRWTFSQSIADVDPAEWGGVKV
jgi:uncharacterized glyoxalase superfamily protein PhnB